MFVISDNSSEASLTRLTILEILNSRFPLDVGNKIREVLRCSGNFLRTWPSSRLLNFLGPSVRSSWIWKAWKQTFISILAHVFARGEVFWFGLLDKLKNCAEILTQLFAPSPTNLSSIWSDRTKLAMKSTRGVRWHSLYFNVNAALLHFSTLKEIMNEFRSRKGVKTLTDYLNDKELVGYLVWTSLRLLLFYAAGRKVFFLVWSLKDGRNGWKVFEVDGRAKVDSLSKSGRSWAKLDGHFSQGERS